MLSLHKITNFLREIPDDPLFLYMYPCFTGIKRPFPDISLGLLLMSMGCKGLLTFGVKEGLGLGVKKLEHLLLTLLDKDGDGEGFWGSIFSWFTSSSVSISKRVLSQEGEGSSNNLFLFIKGVS